MTSSRLRVYDLRLELDEDDSRLVERAASKLGLEREAIAHWSLIKRSLDARHKPRFTCQIEVTLQDGVALRRLPSQVERAPSLEELRPREFSLRRRERVAVIGAGPAGLFCAHRLAGAGLGPIVIDRGEPVEVRGRHVSRLMHHGELREDSNICFGEGGAGTWSDGKLYTRVSDGRGRHVLETIVALGGPPEILVAGKPHLGTDRLVRLCKAFRADLVERGCEVRFGSLVEDFDIAREAGGDSVRAVVLRGGERIEVDRVVLAVGHSAREMYAWLATQGVAMAIKPFAVARIASWMLIHTTDKLFLFRF